MFSDAFNIKIVDGQVKVRCKNVLYLDHDCISSFCFFSVEIMKETCKDFGSGLFAPVKTRLYSPSTKKYICYSPKGQVRTVVSCFVFC